MDGRCEPSRLGIATLHLIPATVSVSTGKLEIIEQAALALADLYRHDADAHAGSSLRDVALKSQEKFLGLAERLKPSSK